MSPLDSAIEVKKVPTKLKIFGIDDHGMIMALVRGSSVKIPFGDGVLTVRPVANKPVRFMSDRMSLRVIIEELEMPTLLTVWVMVNDQNLFQSPTPNELDMDFGTDESV